jgi:hypothetical protein
MRVEFCMKFLDIEFSDLKFLPSLWAFYKMLFMHKLEFSSLIDCFVRFSKTVGGMV